MTPTPMRTQVNRATTHAEVGMHFFSNVKEAEAWAAAPCATKDAA